MTATTLHYTNYITPQLQLHYATTTTTVAVHHTTSSSCGWGDHCNHCNHSSKHNSNHLSVNQWIRSAIPHSQQPTSPVGFLFWNFRHRLVRYYWYNYIHTYIHIIHINIYIYIIILYFYVISAITVHSDNSTQHGMQGTSLSLKAWSAALSFQGDSDINLKARFFHRYLILSPGKSCPLFSICLRVLGWPGDPEPIWDCCAYLL